MAIKYYNNICHVIKDNLKRTVSLDSTHSVLAENDYNSFFAQKCHLNEKYFGHSQL